MLNNFVAKDRDLCSCELSSFDWDAIIKVTHWLKLFRSATTEMSATKRPMLSSTLAIFRGLQDNIKQIISKISEHGDLGMDLLRLI